MLLSLGAVGCNLSDSSYHQATYRDTNQSTSNQTESYSISLGERNALRQAKSYLSITAFSKQGLIDQLIFEGYSTQEAEYGANNCGVDWFDQARKKANEYLKIMPFSKQGLIDQLEFEKFTHEQAVYGVEAVGY